MIYSHTQSTTQTCLH